MSVLIGSGSLQQHYSNSRQSSSAKLTVTQVEVLNAMNTDIIINPISTVRIKFYSFLLSTNLLATRGLL